MTPIASPSPPRRGSNRTYRFVRQIHLWIGAWGALAAILYGYSGLVMNHRFGDAAWSQGDSEELGRETLVVPAASATTPEQLSLWLKDTHGLDAQVIRKGGPGGPGAPAGAREGRSGPSGGTGAPGAGTARGGDGPPPKWTFSGGTATEAWSVEFTPGAESAEVKRNAHSPLAAVNRLHKGVGGGWAWIVLADSFAIGMLLLGISGMWMWLRGRRPRDMVLSVFALSTVVTLIVLWPSLA